MIDHVWCTIMEGRRFPISPSLSAKKLLHSREESCRFGLGGVGTFRLEFGQ